MKQVVIFLVFLFSFTLSTGKEASSVYVYSLRTHLKSGPRMDEKNILTVKRGDKLEVVVKKGVWFQVQFKNKIGWISKLFVNKVSPVGSATLLKDFKSSEAKTSRRRSSSYAVAAAARGLTVSERARGGRALYRSDLQALAEMEEFVIDQKALGEFQVSGKLLNQ